MDKISNNFKIAIVFVLVAVVFFSSNGRNPAYNRDRLVQELRVQIKEELREEVKRELQSEIQQLVEEGVKAKLDSWSAAQNEVNLAKTGTSKALEPEYAFKESEGMSDFELEHYVASGAVEPDIEISPGIKKSSQPIEQNSAGTTMVGSNKAKAKGKSKKEQNDADEFKERPESIERTLQQRGSILLAKGKGQIEPSLTYAHFSSNRINIQGFSILPVLVIGDISTEEVQRDISIASLSLKYGLLNNFQTELKIPYRAEFDRISTSSTSETTRSTSGIGDVEFGVSRQIGWEDGLMPDLVAGLNVKSNTGRAPYNNDIGLGTGHWALRGSLIAAKSSDPAVVFGSLSYTHNFQRNGIENFGDVKPGDSIGWSVGTAIALSYKVAMTFAFDNSITFKMTRDGRTIADSFLNSANFKTGLNWAVNEKRSVDFSVGFGLTSDSPDFIVEIRFPFAF